MMFEGKTVVLTGAASGIGAATLRLLSRTEADLHVVDLAPINNDRAASYEADLGDPLAVADLVRNLPSQVDCLINCAGIPNGGRFSAAQVMAVNWFGLRLLTENLMAGMSAGGSVVHIASTAGRAWTQRRDSLEQLVGIEVLDETMAWIERNERIVGDGYSLSKEAVIYYTLHRATETIQQGIRMNCISPGVTETPIAADFIAGVGAGAIERAIEVSGRIAQPSEMAPALLFLADDKSSSYINGVNLTIDRGINAARLTGRY